MHMRGIRVERKRAPEHVNGLIDTVRLCIKNRHRVEGAEVLWLQDQRLRITLFGQRHLACALRRAPQDEQAFNRR